ncbi:MAG: chromate resistance protein ChrB domain-containing protein [Methylococcales bacterium]
MKWITRERPKIDRIACPWLIARFINPDVPIFAPNAYEHDASRACASDCASLVRAYAGDCARLPEHRCKPFWTAANWPRKNPRGGLLSDSTTLADNHPAKTHQCQSKYKLIQHSWLAIKRALTATVNALYLAPISDRRISLRNML